MTLGAEQNLINKMLPQELLQQVFRHLGSGSKHQLAAMSTCVRWSQILSDERFLLQNYGQRLDTTTIYERVWKDWQHMGHMKQFRAFYVRDYKHNQDFLKKLRQFLADDEVRASIEELHLVLFKYTVEQCLVGGFYPNLTKLVLHTTGKEAGPKEVENFKLVAPNLRIIEARSVTSTIIKIIQTFSEQIEDLYVSDYTRMTTKIFGDKPFKNLRRLAIRLDIKLTSLSVDVFRNLKRLVIWGNRSVIQATLGAILEIAPNLETLIVDGDLILSDHLVYINALTKLKECDLSTRSKPKPGDGALGLALPNLRHLTTAYRAEFPLEAVPNLRALKVTYNRKFGNDPTVIPVGSYFDSVAEQLEVLVLTCAEMNTLANYFVKFKNLKVLRLFETKIKYEQMDRILSVSKTLQYIDLRFCIFIWKEFITKVENLQNENWVYELSDKYSDVVIINHQGRFK